MNVTTAKAALAAASLKDVLSADSEVGIDPAVLQTILQILQSLVSALAGCKTPPAQAAVIAAKPSPFHKLFVRRAVLANTDRPFYDLYGKEVVQAVLGAAATATEAEMAQMYAEASQAAA